MKAQITVPGGIFTVRPLPTLITLVMFVGLLSLGFWQVERLHWKEDLLASIHTRMQQPFIDVNAVKADEADYRPAYTGGVFDYSYEIYVHAISLTGQGGWHVLTPMKLDDGTYLLVDRGFVNYEVSRLPPFYRPEGHTLLKGILRTPHHHWPQPNNNPAKNDWYWPDLKALAKTMNVPEFLPFVLEVDATPNPGIWPMGGQTRLDIPNNHFVYALIWFSLATALLVIYLVSGFSKAAKL